MSNTPVLFAEASNADTREKGTPLVPQMNHPSGSTSTLPFSTEAVGVRYSPQCGRYLVVSWCCDKGEGMCISCKCLPLSLLG